MSSTCYSCSNLRTTVLTSVSTVPRFPSNAVIAEALAARCKKRIRGTAYQMVMQYHLAPDSLNDLMSRAHLHLCKTDWQSVLYRGGLRPRKNDSLERIVNFLAEYALSLVLNSMRHELRAEASHGLRG